MPKILPHIAGPIIARNPGPTQINPQSSSSISNHHARRKPVPVDCPFLPWGKHPAPRSPSPELKELTPPSYHRKQRLPGALMSQPPVKPPPSPHVQVVQAKKQSSRTEEIQGRQQRKGSLPASRDNPIPLNVNRDGQGRMEHTQIGVY